MEDYVRAHVDDMYERLKAENVSWLTCDCENCRMDTECYVLNRIPPKYTISGRGVNHAQSELETAKQVYLNRTAKIGTTKLNEVMLPLIEAYPPPSIKGKYIKIKYCSQVPNTQIPTFVFYANLPQYVKEPYKRFLENKIRENWQLSGCPINVFVRQK